MSHRWLLVSALVLSACSSSSSGADPTGGAGAAGGGSAGAGGGSAGAGGGAGAAGKTSVPPGGDCKTSMDCACWKCDCGGGVTGSNYGCALGKCMTPEVACMQACSPAGTAGVATEDPTWAACTHP